MAMFQYVARRYSDGSKVRGKRGAEDREELVHWLRTQSLFAVAISQAGGKQRVPKVKPYPLSVFCREMSRLLNAGLPLLTVLDSLGQHCEDRALGQMVRAIEVEIQSGTTMSEAWQLHCLTFNEIGSAVIAAGEVSGKMPDMLMTLADYLEEAVGIRAKVLGALWYPATLATAAGIMTSLFIIVVLPKMKTLLDSLNVELPLLTRGVLGVTDFMVTWWPLILLLIFGAVGGVGLMMAQPKTRLIWDTWILHWPIVGTMLRLSATYRFAQTSSVLIDSGIPVGEAFVTTAATIGNRSLREKLIGATADMTSGKTIAEALSDQNLFSPMAIQMVHAGEISGQLPEMLHHLSSYCSEVLDRKVQRLNVVLEPAVVVPVAALVATIVAAMLLPYFKLMGSIK